MKFKTYLKSLLLVVLLTTLMSCEVSKKLLTTDNTKRTITTERKSTIRKGDTLSIVVPNIKYKDTTITKYNYETKTVARLVYDNQGNKRVDCISAEIREQLETIKEDIKNDIKTKNETDNSFKPQYLFYSIIALIIVLIIGMVVGYILLSRLTTKNI